MSSLASLSIAPQSHEEIVLRLLVQLGAQCIGAEEGSLLVYDPKAKDLVFAMVVGDVSSETKLKNQRVPLGQGITGLAAATREVQIGAPTYKGVVQSGERATPGEPEGVIAAPMLVDDVLVGVITAVTFVAGKRFTGDHARLYAQIGAVAGVVVQQRQQIKANETALGSSLAAGGAEMAVQQIAGSIDRLRRARPDALRHVGRMLQEIEALVSAEGG